VIAQAQAARADVAHLSRELTASERDLRLARQRAAGEVASLEQARSERAAYLGELQRRRQIEQHRVAELESRARAAETRARAVAVQAEAATSIASIGTRTPPAPPSQSDLAASRNAGVRTLVVVTTGYALPGTTATGLPVGHGIVAVDPTVIPLGTRMTIPGYGEAVAADTGGAIKGVRVDIWFPTRKKALAWGWQTLTVTLH
jgi:3D (Asp-Asp-Asp) domain-containing protein